MPERLKTVQSNLENVYRQVETAKAEKGKPFPQEEELKTKSARLAELNAELNIDERTPVEQLADSEPAKSERMRSEGIGGITLNKQKAKWGPLCPACQTVLRVGTENSLYALPAAQSLCYICKISDHAAGNFFC